MGLGKSVSPTPGNSDYGCVKWAKRERSGGGKISI